MTWSWLWNFLKEGEMLHFLLTFIGEILCAENQGVFWMKPSKTYLFKFNNRSTRKRCEICSKLTIKTPERCHGRSSGVFIANFEHISPLFLIFLLFTLNKCMLAGNGFIWPADIQSKSCLYATLINKPFIS